jgi:hypothetical protein
VSLSLGIIPGWWVFGLCVVLHMGRRLGETLVNSHFAHSSGLTRLIATAVLR